MDVKGRGDFDNFQFHHLLFRLILSCGLEGV